jgi:N-methylhydantoinase B
MDPISLVVIQNKLTQVCNEMDIIVERAAFCPIVSEARDRASGIYASDNGEVVAQGDTGLPLFVGSMQFAVQAAMRVFSDWQPGDVAIVNDPYESGTHLMDLKIVAPVFDGESLLCFLAQTAHWTDMGGMVPGGFAPEATEIFQEGLRIPPVRLVRAGAYQDDMHRLIMSNVRFPEDREGDLSAQLGALNVGAARIGEMIEQWGRGSLFEAFDELRRRSERHMRSLILDVPDGTYTAMTLLDNDGITDVPLSLSLSLEIEGSDITFDFSGSSKEVQGPLNASPVATASAVFLAMKHIFPEVPINGGCFRSLNILPAPGTFVNGAYPHAVSGAASEVTIRVVDVVRAALCAALPGRVGADSYGTICNYTVSGMNPATGKGYIVFGFLGGGYGGSEGYDGLANGCSSISIAKTSPIEVIEAEAPIRVLRYLLRDGSGGPGRYRGGLGVEIAIQIAAGDASCTVLGDRGKFAPEGRFGGGQGLPTEVWWELAGERMVPPLVSKCGGVQMNTGDVLVIRTPGGGGYGAPGERDRELVKRDVLRGFVSVSGADHEYSAR